MFGDFPLSGKIVLITGGASGIGLAFCRLALSSGAKVVLADLKSTPEADELLHEDSNARLTTCDVGKWADLEALISFSEAQFGDVPDVYAANAGVGESKRSGFWTETETDRYSLLDINLGHPIKLARIAIRSLVKKNKKGVVIVTSSIAGNNWHFGTPLYVASKHGTIGLVQSLGPAEDEANVKVVAICPGLVNTPLLAGIMEAGGAELGVMPAMVEREEIAARMKDLIEQGRYRGGTALTVCYPGKEPVVLEAAESMLEQVAPSDLGSIREVIAMDRSGR